MSALAMALISFWVTSAGCRQSSAGFPIGFLPSESTIQGSHTERREFTAGIVFVDKPNFLCLSFEDLGLSDSDEVASLRSSCDCVHPQVVMYQRLNNEIGYAVFLEFDSGKGDGMTSRVADKADEPKQLGVVVKLQSTDGSSKEFVVNLLYTSALDESRITYSWDAGCKKSRCSHSVSLATK